MKKFAGYIIILHTGTKNHNTWCIVPETWSETDMILCHWAMFCPFTNTPSPLPLNNPKIQNFEKNENNSWRFNSIMVHMCKMIISLGVFFIFSKFWFFGLLGGKMAKNGPKWQKNSFCCAWYLRNHTLYDYHLCYTCVKW